MEMGIEAFLQTGGVLAFAGVVYLQLKEQTAILRQTSAHILKILERQDLIMDRQKSIKEDLETAGIPVRALPKPGKM